MTEAEWLACDDPTRMLAALPAPCSLRKVRLYLCAGARSLWHLLYDERSRCAVEVLEVAADLGLSDANNAMRVARYYAESPAFGYHFESDFVRSSRDSGTDAASIARLLEMGVFTEADLLNESLGEPETTRRLVNLAAVVEHSFNPFRDGQLYWHLLDHLRDQDGWPGGGLVREVFGNPFRPPTVSAYWLAWGGRIVSQLAQGIYAERAFDRLPILADALEDAGCADAALLEHLRGPGPHVRGCWALDVILGKS